MGSRPVVRASRFTASTWSADGSATATSAVRARLAQVRELRLMPSMAWGPSQYTDEIGARFGLSSGLTVLSSTTGVPKYKMAGSVTTCVRSRVSSMPSRRPGGPEREVLLPVHPVGVLVAGLAGDLPGVGPGPAAVVQGGLPERPQPPADQHRAQVVQFRQGGEI